MTLPALKRLKRIVARLTRGQRRGTAFLVGKKHVLTCAHCLGDDKGDEIRGGPIRLHFDWWNDKKHNCIASIEQIDWDIDIALLKLDEEAPVDLLPLATSVENKKEWAAFGYPVPTGHDGFTLAGLVRDPEALICGATALQLKCDEGADKINGASGAPIMVDDQIVGILTNQLLRYNDPSGDGVPGVDTVPVFRAVYAYPLGKIPHHFIPDGRLEEFRSTASQKLDAIREAAISECKTVVFLTGEALGMDQGFCQPMCRGRPEGESEIESRIQGKADRESAAAGTGPTARRRFGVQDERDPFGTGWPIVSFDEWLRRHSARTQTEEQKTLRLIDEPGGGKTTALRKKSGVHSARGLGQELGTALLIAKLSGEQSTW